MLYLYLNQIFKLYSSSDCPQFVISEYIHTTGRWVNTNEIEDAFNFSRILSMLAEQSLIRR